jgi:hypothetical protein
METCSQVTKISAEIAMAADHEAIPEELTDRLFSVFYGTGQLYLNNQTVMAVGKIGSQAIRCNAGLLQKNECSQPVFNAFSMKVGQACRDMLTASWDLPLESLNSENLQPNLTEL